jgi:phage terminase large subunit-like protein
VSVSVDYILEEISKAEESLANKAEFMTKFACIKQNSSMAWLSSQDIGKCFQEQRPLESFRHTYALGGIDLSLAVDLTAAVICIEQDGITWFETQFFMPANKVEEATARDGLPYRIYQQRGLLTVCGENTVDYHEVQNWFNRLEKEYEILPLKVGYDRYSAAYLVQDMEADGYQMESVSQGSNLTGVLIDMEGMIKDGRLRCMSDNDLMKVHMLDAALKFEEGTNRRRLIKMNAKAHIDGMAALSDAICMRHNYYEEYAGQLSNKR